MASGSATIAPDLFDHGAYPHISKTSDARLRVNVIRTTEEGTLAALRSAAQLSKDLCGQIVLLAPETVPVHFSLERPHVPRWFVERRLLLLASEAGVVEEEFEIRVSMCRRRKTFLKQALAPHSLVVMGAESGWGKIRHNCLARWLRAERHHLITVHAGARKLADRKLDRGRMAQYLRARQIEEFREAFG